MASPFGLLLSRPFADNTGHGEVGIGLVSAGSPTGLPGKEERTSKHCSQEYLGVNGTLFLYLMPVELGLESDLEGP
jgi:hypothetical protein